MSEPYQAATRAEETGTTNSWARRIADWLYPLLWIWLAVTSIPALFGSADLTFAAALRGGGMAAVLLACEWVWPLQKRWGMTTAHLFRRDVWMLVANGAALAGLNVLVAGLAIAAASEPGVLAGYGLPLQIVVGLLVFEALQYGLHRFMHTCPGRTGVFFWRSHAIHHLPQQLYFVMHGVFHPVNGWLVRIIVQLLPVWWLGYSAEAAFVISGIIGMHGMISHFNVDLRLGFMNYLFVGPELHRLHHAMDTPRGCNYGVTLSLFDLLFKSFVYQPGRQPATLGLAESQGYPGQHRVLAMLVFPFRGERG